MRRRKQHAERAGEVGLAERLAVFEDAFGKVTRVAAKKKSSAYASEHETRVSRSPDSELREVIYAVQHELRSAAMKNPTKFGALANKV